MQTLIDAYLNAPGAPKADESSIREALVRYLKWVKDAHGLLVMGGVQKEREFGLKLPLNELFVALPIYDFSETPSGERSIQFHQVVEVLTDLLQQNRATARRQSLRKEKFLQHRTLEPLSLIQLADRIVITGGPGSGKTTYLRYIASAEAELILSETNNPDNSKDLLLPLLIPLNAYAKHLSDNLNSVDPQSRTISTFISHYLIRRQAALAMPQDFFERMLAHGKHIVLLLDGLDEIPTEEERVIVNGAIQDLGREPAKLKIIVTTRTSAYKGNVVFPIDFREVRLGDVDYSVVEQIVKRFYRAIYPNNESEQRLQSDSLMKTISQLERQRNLLGDKEPLINSPLLVRMITIVHFNQRSLPDQRAGLYRQFLDTIITPIYNPDPEVAIRLSKQAGTVGDQLSMISYLAFEMHRKGEKQGRTISEYELTDLLSQNLAKRYNEERTRNIVENFVTMNKERASLLDELYGSFQFVHLSLQEFLAARYLAENKRLPEEIVLFLEQENAINDPWWREVILLTAGYFNIVNPETAYEFVTLLADVDNLRRRNISVRVAALELAGMALLEWQGESTLRKIIAERIAKDLFGAEVTSIPLHRRASAGRVYAQLGETRSDVRVVVPTTVLVPKGSFIMGYFDVDFLYVNLPSLRAGETVQNCEAFEIGQYPVTNSQFAEFIKAGGYIEQSLWTVDGWSWKEENLIDMPAYWNDVDWNISSYPVVGVSWYEAVAYCNWLRKTTGRIFRLPSEAEWEKASRGTDGRKWPWGNENRLISNTLESGIGRTTIVGLLPETLSPFGVNDCAGNIWEWCNSLYWDYPYNADDGREDLKGVAARCHRGGSWLNPQSYAMCPNRDRYFPGDRHYDLGFRVAVVPV